MVHLYTFLWFIPAIITLYAIFPLYYKVFLKSENKLLFTSIVFIVWMLFLFIFKNIIRDDLYIFLNRIPVFIIGILYGWYSQNKPLKFSKTIYLVLMLYFLLGLFITYLTTYKKIVFFISLPILFLPNFIIGTSLPFLMAKFFNIIENTFLKYVSKLLYFYGMFSFELYCVQEIIFQLLIRKFINIGNTKIFNFLVLYFSTLFGLLLYYLNKALWQLIERNTFRKNLNTDKLKNKIQ